ncbi:MAG: rubrerythrin family protein [wastewater metagenome]|nr:rubrerythrin family protein [Candidatus Loosdrechtia aerotolerans]
MKEMNEQHFMNAFGGKSQSHVRYRYFAAQAEAEKLPNVARLFRAIAYSEYIQASNYHLKLGHLERIFTTSSIVTCGFGNTKKNLALAITGKEFGITEMYPPEYKGLTKSRKEKITERNLLWNYLVERLHKKLLEKVKKVIDKNHDIEPKSIHICRVCGYTRRGELPNKCPICKVTKEKFTTFT